jgi:hypothetical protein
MDEDKQRSPLESVWRVGSILLLALVLIYSPIIDTWAALKSSLSSVTGDLPGFRTHLATPNAGAEVLPSQVQEMRAILETYTQIADYSLSQPLQENALIYQRAVEGLWPRKLASAAPYQFILLSDAERYAQCVEVASGKEIALVRCD